MIYTVTFNPALDYVMRFGEIEQGSVNRSISEDVYIGGKGINVSLVLKELGVTSVALGFAAGFTGNVIEQELSTRGVKTDFIKLAKGITRINVKLKSTKETDLNAGGPEIKEEDINKLFEKISSIKENDTLVLAGSVPNSLPADIYNKILNSLSGRNIKFVVDATGELLLSVLKYKPFLVKPNDFELGEIFGVKIRGEEDILFYAQKLKDMGAVNVLVSRAADGAILLDQNGVIHKTSAASGVTVNSVGAGDSMVAGFLAGFEQTGDYGYALKLGTAAGGATAFSEWLGTKEKITELFNML